MIYGQKVREGLAPTPHTIHVAHPANADSLLQSCDVIMVGGGNTFKLLHNLHAHNLIQLIKTRVQNGTPYIGWSAGSNLTGLSIGTTNDMPIIQPIKFEAFQFFPFQINPHYYNEVRPGFHGETRDQRLEEFALLNPGVPIVCLPEGSWLQTHDEKIFYDGNTPGMIMQYKNSLLRHPLPAGSQVLL